MNRILFRTPAFACLLALIFISVAGCRERTLISSKVSPANDTANISSKALGCITHTYYDNDILTSTNISGIAINQAVGAMSDPFFGDITGATYFQIAPVNAGIVFDSSEVIDSAILVLPYSGFTYGDTTDHTITQSYQAFFMTDTLAYYSNYYPFSDKSIDMLSPLSAPVSVNIYHLMDSVYVTDKNAAGLRIPLNVRNLMARLNPALESASSSAVAASAFVSAFNGICVRPADTRKVTKAIPYFRLDGTDDFVRAGVIVYFHGTTTPTVVDSESFYYAPTGCAHFNNIVKSFRSAPVNNLYHSTQANDSIVAIQNQPGASIDLKVYGINSIPAGVVINKAQLQLSILTAYNPIAYAGPERIYPVGVGNGTFPAGVTAGATYLLEDYKPITSLSPYTILDGQVHTINNVTTYTIGIPREVITSIAAKNDTLHLRLNGTQDYYGAFHMVAAGGSYADSNLRAKLVVVYSTLKH